MIEVKAMASFGTYRMGKVYLVDETSETITGLLGVGYLAPTKGEDDDRVSGDTVRGGVPVAVRRGDSDGGKGEKQAKTRAGSGSHSAEKGKLRSEVNDGEDRPEPGTGDQDGPEQGQASR